VQDNIGASNEDGSTPSFILLGFESNGVAYLNNDLQSLVDRVRAGEPRALARAITAVENRVPEATNLLRQLFPYTGKARVIGLTGAPGSGKSTLVDQLARAYRHEQRTVGIVAVDPTSPYTGGAIL